MCSAKRYAQLNKMQIGFGYNDEWDELEPFVTFKECKGMEGEFPLHNGKEDSFGLKECELRLISGSIGLDQFNSMFSKGEIDFGSNFFIYIIDSDGVNRRSCGMTEVEILEIGLNKNDKTLGLKISGYLSCLEKGEYGLWKNRIENGLNRLGEWKNLQPEEIMAWLRIGLSYNSGTNDRSHLKVEINGDDLTEEDYFYCALGEAVNGPGGYFGLNLDALDDCFCGDFGVKSDFTLVWNNHSNYKRLFPKKFGIIKEIIEDKGQTLILK
ncbi:MAG: hypothetical protein COA99_17225 [Moraxellaceae bacterium]|nr:MAG: hypothetical protein COA99_17225 [Moraxellaceae bacterium]